MSGRASLGRAFQAEQVQRSWGSGNSKEASVAAEEYMREGCCRSGSPMKGLGLLFQVR